MKLHSSETLSLVGPKRIPQRPILEHSLPSNSMRDKVSQPYTARVKVSVLCILIFISLTGKREDKSIGTEKQ
jgi:hypothetical protein